jgi:cytochrome c
MDSFELNKVLGAVLGTCLALLSLNIAAGALFTNHVPEKPGYEIAVVEQPPAGGPAAAPAAEVPIEQRLASADVARGETSAKKCVACHTFGKGEPNRVGPNLWGIVGRPKAVEAGFNYSAAMKNQKGNWTVQDLDHYLANPRASVPGTNMTFAGIPRGSERADLIAFLNSKADNPAPLPKAAATPPAAPAAAAPPTDRQAATPPAASPQPTAPSERPAEPATPAEPPQAAAPAPAPGASPPPAAPAAPAETPAPGQAPAAAPAAPAPAETPPAASPPTAAPEQPRPQ